jgi:hypothetical protein
MPLTEATQDAIWLGFLLSEILDCQYKILPSITILAGNQRYITLAHDPEYYVRTKHTNIEHHFDREKVE